MLISLLSLYCTNHAVFCRVILDVNKTTILPKLKCFYTNADQLFNKLPELMVRTRDNKPDIIGITEVKNKIQVSQSIRFEKLVNTKCLLKTLIR
jgi:hypothetical protein